MDAGDVPDDQAMLAMTLIARRASAWAHDKTASQSISNGYFKREAIVRFKRDILEALAILDRDHEQRGP